MSLGLRLSLFCNLVLIVAAATLLLRMPSNTEDGSALEKPAKSATVTKTPLAPTVTTREGARLTPDTIAQLESEGISRDLVVAALRHDFRRRWSKRTVELENKFAPRQPPQREYLILQRQQDEAQIRELKETLGEEGYVAWDKAETLRKLNFEEVPMNPAEADQAYRLQKQLDDKLHLMQIAMEDGDADVADMGTLQMQAQDAYEKELEKLLGTKRYNELKGYNAPLVEGHMEYNELSPSEEQVTALKTVESDYSAREAELTKNLRDKPQDATAIAAELQAMNAARDERLRKTLGAQAYDQLKRDHDATYQELTQFAPAWNLKETEIGPVYDQVKAFQDSVDRLRQAAQMTELAGQTVDRSAIRAVIEKQRQQTEAALQTLIGSDRVARLAKNGLLSPLGSDRNSPHPPSGL